MKKVYLILLFCLFSAAGFAQTYCTPGWLYASASCSSYGMGISGFYVNGSSGSISDASTCSGSGYENMTSLSCTMQIGGSYTLTVNTGSTYSMNDQVWVDFNNDGTFATSETVGGFNGYTTAHTMTLTIPSTGVSTGSFRMRIVHCYAPCCDGAYPTMDACASGYYYGDCKDYIVTLVPPPPSATVSPTSLAFGGVTVGSSSAAQSFNVAGTYLSPASGSVTITAPSGYLISSTGTSGWTSSYTISYTSATLGSTPVYVEFNPTTATTYSGNVTVTGGGLSAAVNEAVSGTGAAVCSGTPTAGTANITPSSGTGATSFTLSLSGGTVAGGLTYQWQSSPDGSTWTDISGATTPAYSFSGHGATTYYQCIVVCPGYGGSTSSSATATFVLPSASCTPAPTYASAACSSYGMYIHPLNLTGSVGSISDGTSCGGSGYEDETSLSCTLYKGGTYTVSIGTGSSYSMYYQMWIDFNGDGTFQTTESVGGNTSPFLTSGTVSISVPTTVPSGTFRMRIVGDYQYDGYSYPTMNPCMSGYNYGDSRDYKIIIAPPPPSASVTPTSLAFGPVTTGTSSATQSFSLSGSYLLPASGSFTVTAPSNFLISSTGTSGWTSSYNVSYTGATLAATTVYAQFNPTAATTYSGNITVSGGGIASTINVPVTGTGAAICSGTPTAGSSGVSPTSGSPITSFTLTESGYTAAGGIGFQWQSSPDGTTWTDITGATSLAYTFTGIAANTYFRCNVSCSSSGLSATSSAVMATFVLPAASCTPAPTYASAACSSYGMYLKPVSINGAGGTSFTDNMACTGSGYEDRTSLSCTLYKANSYTLSIGTGSSYYMYTQAWIDFNSDGIFQTTESVGGNTTSFVTSGTITLTIPTSAPSGTYRMRLVGDYSGDGHSYSTMDPCMAGYNYGEGRDYRVVITAPPPSNAFHT